MKNKLNLIGIILLVFGILTVAVTMFVIDFIRATTSTSSTLHSSSLLPMPRPTTTTCTGPRTEILWDPTTRVIKDCSPWAELGFLNTYVFSNARDS